MQKILLTALLGLGLVACAPATNERAYTMQPAGAAPVTGAASVTTSATTTETTVTETTQTTTQATATQAASPAPTTSANAAPPTSRYAARRILRAVEEYMFAVCTIAFLGAPEGDSIRYRTWSA